MTTDLSPSDELNLYKTDRRAWAIATAPRRAAQLAAITDPAEKRRTLEQFGTDSQAAILAFLTDPAEKQRLWEQFGDESRQALRELAARQAHERATAGDTTAAPAHTSRSDQSRSSDSDA